MFCLFYNAKTKKIEAMNGSGRSGMNCTLENVRKDLGLKDGEKADIPLNDIHAVTVPGAAAGWADTVERFGSGKLSLEQVLMPAIELGERGFPVSELSSTMVYPILSSVFCRIKISDFQCSGETANKCSKKHPQITKSCS
jgi:gamma-glutamyltranspeptidase / glutathione hydrolase